MHAKNNLFISSSPLLRQVIIKSGMMGAASDELASRLAALCEQFYLNRQIEQLTEAAGLLVSLPGERAQAAGRYYQALVHIRQGEHERAARLLESVAGCESAPKFRARAIQSLGVIHRREGDRAEAARLYHQAASLAGKDPITLIRAGMTLAELSSSEGDHRGSIDQLRALQPSVEIVARIVPVYLPLWANDIASDLASIGRIEEARRFAALAVSSPFARAYPEWLETAQEIEQESNVLAAHKSILRVVVAPPKVQPLPRPPRNLFLIRKLVLNASRRPVLPRQRVFRQRVSRCTPVSALVAICAPIRAPSFIDCL